LFSVSQNDCDRIWTYRNGMDIIWDHMIRRIYYVSRSQCMHLCEITEGCKAVMYYFSTWHSSTYSYTYIYGVACSLESARVSPSTAIYANSYAELYETYCKGKYYYFKCVTFTICILHFQTYTRYFI
jgi:hypothetical protein